MEKFDDAQGGSFATSQRTNFCVRHREPINDRRRRPGGA
jgi:hypothetical protein